MIVAIDGPAGAGKTTVARAVADRLGFAHLDTGALYRVVTMLALERGLDLDDAAGIAAVIADADIAVADGKTSVGSRDVTAAIRSPDVTAAVSQVAAHPAVRRALVGHQRSAAATDVVIEGRDIGTHVFPDADVKVFLTATPRARALRRARELGEEDAVDRFEAEIAARDRADSTRSASPLARAADALELDTSEMAFAAVVDRVVAAVTDARRAG